MLAVAVTDVTIEGEYQFERRLVGTSPRELRTLAEWFVREEVEEVVMESTAPYWRPVWAASFASPKSSSLTRLLLALAEHDMAGFRSRCVMPFWCAAASASAIGIAIFKRRSSGIPFLGMEFASDRPSTSSIVRKN